MGNWDNIEDYGFIGDCHGAALISKEASIDWLTMERFDNSPHFWSLLDQDNGGSLRVHLLEKYYWSHHYIEDTNILVTEASNEKSSIRIIDFMPLGRRPGSRSHDYTSLNTFHSIVRRIEVKGAPLKLRIEHKESFWDTDQRERKHFLYLGKEELTYYSNTVYEWDLQEQLPLNLVISNRHHDSLKEEQLIHLFNVTKNFWQEWIAYSQYNGPHKSLINRSALTLKMLIHAETGAIMAAPTTSLPEALGAERNWDYRFCWLRDATFTLYALGYLGFSGEADAFSQYIEKIIRHHSGPLQVLYSLDGNSLTPEKEIKGVLGYKNSSPVRVGNDAYKQSQLDTHGEFLDWAYLHKQLGGEISPEVLTKIEQTAQWVSQNWKQKDRGLWELRGVEEDFTYSKIMCWVTLNRAASLLNDKKLFEKEMREIEDFIQFYCIKEGRLIASAQSNHLDASLLLVKIVGYPIEEKVYEKTVDEIMRVLSQGAFIKRYENDDGLQGKEGAFVICSFWAVNACLFLGRYEKAKELFEKLINCFSDLGLLSEEIDSESGHFLGNFPQALSHLAFIETASYFELFKKGGKEALLGCHGDRANSLHSTLHGARAVWNFVRKTGNFRKIFPSSESVLNSH